MCFLHLFSSSMCKTKFNLFSLSYNKETEWHLQIQLIVKRLIILHVFLFSFPNKHYFNYKKNMEIFIFLPFKIEYNPTLFFHFLKLTCFKLLYSSEKYIIKGFSHWLFVSVLLNTGNIYYVSKKCRIFWKHVCDSNTNIKIS